MTRIHADQLPPEVRKRLGLDKTTKAKPSRAGTGESAPCPGHCGCGLPFPTAAAWLRHADTEHHTVWSIDITEGSP